MSFVKIPRRTARSSAPAPKRKPKKKPVWDDSNNDLTVHAATPEELVHRKVVHESKNMDLVKAEKLHQKISKASRQNRTQGKKKQMPLLREVLYDQNQLQDVLAKSDRAMAVVRDLFGDDPRRYRGLPNVTVAPNQVYLDGSLPTGKTIDGPSKLDMLSDSVMDKTALNEYDAHGTDTEDEDDGTLQYKPLLDFGRFRKFLEDEQERAKQDDNLQKAQDAQDVAKRMEAEMHQLGIKSPDEVDARQQVTSPHDGSFIEEQTPATTPRVKAMNDTGKVNRVRSRLGQNEQEESMVDNNNTNNSTLSGSINMDDLRKVLDGLEGNLAAYEQQTGRTNTNRSVPPQTFSGYTMSLVNAVNKLTVYLKESELRLRAETMVREQLTEDVDQLKTLIDTLTSDLIGMQEDYSTQQDEFYKYRLSTQQELHNIKAALVSQGISVGDGAQASNLRSGQPSSEVPQDNRIQTRANVNPASTVPASRQPLLQPPQPQQAPQATRNMPPPQPTQQPQNLQQLQQSQHQLQQQYQQNQQLLQQYQKEQQQLQQQPQQQQQQQHLQQQHHQQQQKQQQQQQQQQQRAPSQVAGNLLSNISGQHDISNMTTQQLQTLLLQQMMMSQRQASDLGSQHNQTTDSSLEQHPLSSSMTSQSTLQSVSSGRPVLNLPMTSQPPSVLPAMLLTPPRQTNSPQAQNKTQAHANSLSAAMDIFKQEGRLDALKNVIYKQQVAVQNGDMQSPDETRVQRPGQFRPIPMDSDHQDALYFSQHQHTQHVNNSQRPLQGQQRISQVQDRPGQGHTMPGQSHNQLQCQGISSQQANTSVTSAQSTGPAERIELNREVFARQIEELNRQHAEAEGKLGRLLHNQYSAVQALAEVAPARHISPSISPIPAGSESAVTILSDMSSSMNYTREQLVQRPGGGGTGTTHGITVSLPRMEMLNWSDTSTPTLSTSKTVSHRDSNSPVPIMTISPSEGEQTPFKDNQKVNPQSAFFALSTHVS